MFHSKDETLTIGWCDPGTVDGLFMNNLLDVIFYGSSIGIKNINKIRVEGNQIGRQRQVLFDCWADQIKSDWLLWIDSDIIPTQEVFKLVWDTADKINKPVVSGTYFISKEHEQSLMEPFPSLFIDGRNEFEIEIVHPLPDNKVIKVDSAGFGFVLMHKSIINKLRDVSPDYSLFAEKENIGDKYVGEDIMFFKNLKKANIPLYAHTGALLRHIKRFSLDINYYNLYWNGKEQGLFNKND